MTRAFLGLGSNIGAKCAHLNEAARRIACLPGLKLIAVSRAWRTPPWGPVAQDWYANAVLEVETTMTPEALLEAALGIERAMGRERTTRWGPRLIDIDLLIHGEETRGADRLTLPHPAMLQRAFVLVPLHEIAPGLKLAGESVAAHLARVERGGIEPLGALDLALAPA